MDFPNFENIVYLHVCNNPMLFKHVDDDFFKNEFVSKLYKLTKSFYTHFKSIPFKLDEPSIEQIAEVANRNVEKIITDQQLEKEDNLKIFLTNAEHIISSNYKKYDAEWLDETVGAWIQWENQQKGFKLAIEYQKTQGSNIGPHNVMEIIRKSKDIVNSRSAIIIDEDEGADFFDPESHKQIDPKDLIHTGYKNLNLWLSGKVSGGFEPGTLSIFIGESNIGKSIWLGNLAFNMMANGSNVLLISLEMATYKIYRRIGANAFNVEMEKYSEFANDSNVVSEYIRKWKEEQGTGMYPIGALRSKKFTKATASDIEAFAKRLEQKLGLKFSVVVIDYMTELENSYGVSSEKSYYYHKQNTNDLYNMAGNNYWAVVTAHQVVGNDFGADDLTLQSLSESKGIIHRTDNIIGIIQSPNMRNENRYFLKNLKTRDGAYKHFKIPFSIDFSHMRLSEIDEMIDPANGMF